MASKRTTVAVNKVPATKPWSGRKCGECANGVWSKNPLNRDFDGKPFLKVCEYSTYAKNIKNERVCMRKTQACEHFREEAKKV